MWRTSAAVSSSDQPARPSAPSAEANMHQTRSSAASVAISENRQSLAKRGRADVQMSHPVCCQASGQEAALVEAWGSRCI